MSYAKLYTEDEVEIIPVGHARDLTGKKFGWLTVLGRAPTNSPNRSDPWWWCRCECGNITKVMANRLTADLTKSCGCYQRKRVAETWTTDLTGQRFGKLVALKDSGKRDSDRSIIWTCKCDCGNIVEVSGHSLKRGMTQSCGCLDQSTGELKIAQLLKQENIPFIQEATFEDGKFSSTHGVMRFDFYVDNRYIIEYDGKQHFRAVEYFGGQEALEGIQCRDQEKNEYCYTHKLPLIRIPYTHYKNLQVDDLILETSSFLVTEGEKK